MQTFLPLPDFAASVEVLDRQRLGKQRLEVAQLLNAILGFSKGWTNHPAATMWRGSEMALCEYGIAVCREWRGRGYKDTMLDRFIDMQENLVLDGICEDWVTMPSWFGDSAFHASHRSNLLRKAPEWYSQFGWTEPDSLPYIWPEA